jgi:long-subunit fatty acid transport protein
LSQGGIDRRDASGAKSGSFSAADAAGIVSFSRDLSPRARAGMSAKYIQQKIDDAQATGFAFDLGSQYDLSSRVSLGAAVRNLGADMTFLGEKYKLPLSLTGGASVAVFRGFLVAAELRHEPNVSRTSVNFGTEYQALGAVSLRAGYQALMRRAVSANGAFKDGGSSLGNLSGFGIGIGLKLSHYSVDYALLPGNELDTTHHLSIATRF